MYRRNWCLTVNQCWWDSLETDPKLLLATFLFFVSQTLIAGPFWALTGLGSIFIDFELNSYRNLVRPYKALLCSVSVAFLILLAAFRYLSIPFVQPNNKNSWFLQVWFGRFFCAHRAIVSTSSPEGSESFLTRCFSGLSFALNWCCTVLIRLVSQLSKVLGALQVFLERTSEAL